MLAAPSISGFDVAPMLTTYAVVAICAVLVPAAAVGAVGMPVNPGESTEAREVSVG
jgi:hypothetical protein